MMKFKNALMFVLLLFLGMNLSSSAKEISRPNGWYFIIDSMEDSLSVQPIVTVKDFAELSLDSTADQSTNSLVYRIVGKVTVSQKDNWAIATEKSIGKRIGFLFDGNLLTAPYVKAKIENGNFFITTSSGYDIKLLYKQLVTESGCKKMSPSSEERVFYTWVIRGSLIALFLIFFCAGLFKIRNIKRQRN